MDPHRLSELQKSKHAELSEKLLSILESQKRKAWYGVITLGEFRFHLHTDHELIWLHPGEKMPERERSTIPSEKMMLTIEWNPTGCHVINGLGKGCKFNCTHCITEMLSLPGEWRRNQVGASDQKLIAHADNAPRHTAGISLMFPDEKHIMKAPHPTYSPDLAPSDFFLFGHVKQLL
jgi:hypothetical protein